MVLLNEIMDTFALQQHIEAGNVTARQHTSQPLTILNYTPQCQFARNWDHVTMKCRGLIYNHETGEVVARPFPKFFNWDEGGQPYPPPGPCIRMEKADGSLGILYTQQWDGDEGLGEMIATRGSFESEQAVWATAKYWEIVADQMDNTPEPFRPVRDKTYLFEIIYKENRIVVDYGDYEGLLLLDVIDNATGEPDIEEFDKCNWPDKIGRTLLMYGFNVNQDIEIPDGGEGFVYLWPTRNYRVKMKSAEYVRIHRLVSRLTEKSVWQHLVNGGTLEGLKRDMPEEFHEFIDQAGSLVMKSAGDKMDAAFAAWNEMCDKFGSPRAVPRKDVAIEVTTNYKSLAKYLFLMLDNKPVWQVLLQDSKPETERPALVRE